MTIRPLFLYGTLRDPDILAAVLGRVVPETDLVAAQAPDYAAVYFPGQVYPALVARPGSAAPGLLLAPTPDDLAALDAFEGEEYRRGPLQTVTAEGPVTADVYWPDIPVAPSALDWTLEQWSREHKPLVLARETALALASRLGTARR